MEKNNFWRDTGTYPSSYHSGFHGNTFKKNDNLFYVASSPSDDKTDLNKKIQNLSEIINLVSKCIKNPSKFLSKNKQKLYNRKCHKVYYYYHVLIF